MGNGDLAGPDPAQLDAALKIVEPLFHTRFKIGSGDDDAIFALETLSARFSHLHRNYSSRPNVFGQALRLMDTARFRAVSRPSFGKTAQLVRAEGLEPPRLSSREPKSRASTNSATPATRRAARWRGLYHARRAGHYKNSPP